LIVRFESLALRDEGDVSLIHFEVEDEHAVHRCRARVIDTDDEGHIEVGDVEGFVGEVDRARFAREVERVYREQVAVVARITNTPPRSESCIVALRERELVMEPVAAAS
jgi:hypothetical protein